MPGILPMKVIKVGSSAQARIAQACDRCRSKKIRCDGFRPSCSQCANVGFECKTSDKLSRRAFPRGYTESLEERVRALELEIRELKDLLDAKDDKIDMLSKLHSNGSLPLRRHSSVQSFSDSSQRKQSSQEASAQQFRVHQNSSLHDDSEQEARFVGNSNSYVLLDSLKVKASEMERQCPEFDVASLAPTISSKRPKASPSTSMPAYKGPSRMLSDQMVNIFFQEWAPIFPILHRPSFLGTYEQYVSDVSKLNDEPELVQLNLVFAIATLSNKTRIAYDTSSIESHWLNVLEANVKINSVSNLQCLLLAQMYCVQSGDWTRLIRYKELSVGMAYYLGLNQSQKRFTIGILASETRKKVFWSLYTLDSFTSALLGIPRSLKDHDVHCEYPLDVDDEYISEQGIQPVLPGEFTKLSSALAVFQGARIMAKVMTELYPSHPTYEVSLSTISSLEDELDSWSNSLPPHLKMQFMDEKPSTHVISSRCPLLSLTYHYIRTLIHRPVACFAPGEMSSASTVALAGSSKHIIQIIQLLDERNLSFSFCLNKDELLIGAATGVVLQSLNVGRESKLMKDSQKVICTVLEILKRRQALEYDEFRRICCSLLYFKTERRSDSSCSDSEGDTLVKKESHPIAAHYLSSSHSVDQINTIDNYQCKLPMLPTTVASCTDLADTSKRFRAIAPSMISTHSSYECGIGASPKSSISSGQRGAISNHRPLSMAPATDPSINLDYFRFPADPSRGTEKIKSPATQERPVYQNMGKILSTINADQLNLANEVHDWYSLSGNAQSLEHTDQCQSLLNKPYDDPQRSDRNDSWPVATDFSTDVHGTTSLEPAKTSSLLSFSDESFTSGEDFSSLDWGTSSGEGDDAFRAMMMSSLTPEEASAFGFASDEKT